jgi:uncharacterized protein
MTESDDRALELAEQMLDWARTGEAAPLLALIDQGGPANLRDSKGNSVLMLAAYHGHADLVRALAARGADVDLGNDRGQTPLAGAVFKKDPETVKALIEAGADPDLGTPSARETAQYFGAEELTTLF